MTKYVIKRILLALLILFSVSIILYVLVRCMPANFIEDKYRASHPTFVQEELDRVLAIYGLQDNSFGGIMKGYFKWLGNALKGDFGNSFRTNTPVSKEIFKNMGVSFAIALISLVLELIIAIPLGVKCACNQYGKLDYTATVLCMIGMAFPTFFLGNLFIKWFALDLGWFPVTGLIDMGLTTTNFFVRLGSMLHHLVIPLVVLVILNIGPYMRYMRTNTLEVLNADYIRTARANGLSERKVIYKHVFRNTMIPLVTLLSTTLPMLFGGAMITETIFGIPGIGQSAYLALREGDIPFVMGYNMFIAVLTVVGVLLADFMYMVVDPRVKLK